MLKPLSKLAQAVASTVFISVVPIFFIYALNTAFLSNKETKDTIVLYGISFAIGGLLGDVFFHTLPEMAANSG